MGEPLAVKATVPPLTVPPLLSTVAVSVVVLLGDAAYVGFTLELSVVVVAGRVE
jgi:hypothetical protein